MLWFHIRRQLFVGFKPFPKMKASPLQSLRPDRTPRPIGTGSSTAGASGDGISPKSILDLFKLADDLTQEGHTDLAVDAYRQWVANAANSHRQYALFNLGALLQSHKRIQEAQEAYEECLELDPHFCKAHINLGLLFERQGHTQKALLTWSQVLTSQYLDSNWGKSEGIAALNHIGRVHENNKRYDLAEAALQESLRLDPYQPGVIQHWVHIRQKACRWPVYVELPGISMNKLLMCTSPLAQLAIDDDPAKQLLVATTFVERTYSFKEERLSAGRQYAHTRTRLGYLSGDLCVHAVGLLLAEFFESHDKSRFELYAYDHSIEDGTAHRRRIISCFENVRRIEGLTDRQVAEAILADEIDIMIDLHGASSGARPGIFALHPAPLQGTYLGFIGTTGMPWFDFVIADAHALPAELATYFVEKPLYVEGSFLPLTDGRSDFIPATRVQYGLPEKAYVMASFGNVYKINAPLFDTWLDILVEIPHSILWLIDDNATATANLRAYAARRGIPTNRIVFTPRVSHQAFRGCIRLADVFLDTYPYNCGSTTNDVIEANVPIVTCTGRTMVSRMGASVLRALGQEGLIATNLLDYKRLVIKLSGLAESFKPLAGISPTARADARDRMVRSLEQRLVELSQNPGQRNSYERSVSLVAPTIA